MHDSNGGLFNQTNTTNFLLEVPDGNLTKAFKLNLQVAAVPGIHIPVTEVAGQPQGMHRASLSSATIEFDAVPCRFLVDEKLESWVQCYQWMLACNNYLNRDKSGWSHNDGFPDAVLMHILDNDKRDIVMTIRYVGAWISDLSEIEYSLAEDSDVPMYCTATLNYKYIEVEQNGVIIEGRAPINEAREVQLQAQIRGRHPSMQ